MRFVGSDDGDVPTRRRVLVAVGAGLSSALAGCGDGGTESGSPQPGNDVETAFDDGNSTDGNDNSTESGTATDPGPVAAGPIDIPALERAIGERANEIRTGNGAGLLDWDDDLRQIARDHSEDMIQKDYFAHSDPMGRDFGDRYDAANYDCVIQAPGGYIQGGQNIARVGYMDPPGREQIAVDVVEQWRTGDAARDELLERHWNVQGIGVAIDPQAEDTRIYVTQNFC